MGIGQVGINAAGQLGYSGYSGVSGFSGFSGVGGGGGASGFSGFSGVSGYSGFSGRSGYSGFSGFAFINEAGANVVPKSDGTNLVASQITDDGTVVNVALVGAASSFSVTSGTGASFRMDDAALFSGTQFVAAASIVSLGDVATEANGTKIDLVDASQTITATASTESLAIDGVAHTATLTTAAKTHLNAATGVNVQGTNTNDNAASSFVGELLTASLASGSATSLSTATAKTITSVSLTAGDWEVTGSVQYIPDGTTTTAYAQQGANTTTNTLGGEGTFTSSSGGNLTGTVLGSLLSENIPAQRFSLAATTTVYLVGRAVFAISTMTAYGTIRARRVR